MKVLKIALAFAILVSLLSLSGCNKLWAFDFMDGTPLTDWNIDDWSGGYVYNETGLTIDSMGFTSPFAFTGDLTVTIEFTLDTDLDHGVYMEFGLYDNIADISENRVNFHFDDVGDPAEEGIGISEFGPTTAPSWNYTESYYAVIPGLNRDGENIMVITKTGDDIQISFNGVPVENLTMGFYESDRFAILISSELYDGVMTYNSIKVRYSGEAISLQRP